MLEPSSFSMVSDSIADGNGTKSGARVVDAWKRDSLYAVIAYSVRLSVTVVVVVVVLLLLLLLFLRLRVHVYSSLSYACLLCAWILSNVFHPCHDDRWRHVVTR